MGTASLSSPYSLHQYPYWWTVGIDRLPYVGNEGVVRGLGSIWLVIHTHIYLAPYSLRSNMWPFRLVLRGLLHG